jgi:branched-chain amino acid transport system ATP-binding protein
MPISGSEARPVLAVTDLEVRYGKVIAASGISLFLSSGEIVALLGPNGAGKTSVLRGIAGFVPPASGTVEFFDGAVVHRLERRPTFALARLGIAFVPAQNIVLPRMTVEENLEVGGRYLLPDSGAVQHGVDEMLQRFPVLAERRQQFAGSLSGGEQRQLAIARALLARPRLMLMDEPSIGLSPAMLNDIFGLLKRINEGDDVSILIVEQNVIKALEIANRAYVMRIGGMDFSGSAEEVARSERLADAYLGG